jgi:hypothetical protein
LLIKQISQITLPNFDRAENKPLVIKRKQGIIFAVRTADPRGLIRVTAAIGKDEEGKPVGYCELTVDHIEDAREAAQFAWQIAVKQQRRKTRAIQKKQPS